MRKSSFTDEQLLNLVDNFILKETQHTPEEFTGGSVQVTYSPFHNIVSYSVFIFFGYDDKKNSISVKKKITSQFQDVWYDAINCKTSSMASVANGVELNELNELMNGQDEDSTVDSTVLVQGKVLGNRYKVLGNRYGNRYGNVSTPFVTTSLRSPYEVAIDEDKATEETKQTLLKTDESKADVEKELFEEIWRTYVLDVVKPSTGRNESKTEAMKSFVKVRKLNISEEVLFEYLENHYNETTDKKYLKKLKTLLDDTLTLKEMQKEYNNANK